MNTTNNKTYSVNNPYPRLGGEVSMPTAQTSPVLNQMSLPVGLGGGVWMPYKKITTETSNTAVSERSVTSSGIVIKL